MKKTKIALLMILFMICILTGCGKDESNPFPNAQGSTNQSTNQNTNMNENMEANLQWNVSHTPMLDQYEGATIDDGKIYAYRYGEDKVIVSVFSSDTVEHLQSYEIPGVLEVKSLSVNMEKEVCIFGGTEAGNTLWQIDADGNIRTIENIEVENMGESPELINFYADSNGFYYIWYKMYVLCSEVYEDGEDDVYTALDRIYVKDQQMNTIVYEQVPDSYRNLLLGFSFNEEGIPMLLAMDADGYYVRQMRTSNREEFEAKRLETDEFLDLTGHNIMAFTDDGLLYVHEGALYRYHMSDSCTEKLLELASVGIWEEDIIYLGMHDDTIEIIDNYKESGQSEYTLITQGESQRTKLTLGVMSLQPNIQNLIASFNRYQDQVTIEPIIYVDGWDYDAGFDKLTMDIIQGKAPDLISVYGLEYENLAKMGAFSDLYTYMGEEKEDFVTSILRMYELEGQLFTIAPMFRIYTMWGAESTVKGKAGIDIEQMMQLLSEHGGDINSIFGFSADESVLTTLCAFNMDQFIDWSTGTCDFTGEDFKQIVDFAKNYKGKPYESLYRSVRNGEILLTLGLITGVEDCRLQSELYGEDIQFIGYPTTNGSGSAAFLSGEQLAINAKSVYQKEAWEFIKYCMYNGCDGTGFPVVKEQFDAFLEASMEEDLVYENGQSYSVAKRYYSEPGVVNIQVSKCTPEDVEMIRALVNNVSDKFQYHTKIQTIIDEEVSAYFKGQKNIEDVCAIIQSRVQLYLDEQ